MKKKLMIVGASVLQLPAIIKAKSLGLEVAVVDYNPDAVGIAYADKFYNASTMDEDAVLAASIDYQPDGIMTLATDMPMRGVAKAGEYLGLNCISYDTALKATDKFFMIEAFKQCGVPTPWYCLVSCIEDLYALESKLEYPCIMKPTDNAGSHGVVLAHSFGDLISNYAYSYECSRHGNVIVEEYLDGPEVSVEAMVVNGKVHILQITDKITTGAPYFVELGHIQPSQLPFSTQSQIIDVAERACLAVGIDKGPAHVEIKVTSKAGPKMVELGARMGGDNITTFLVPLSTGIDMVKGTIDVALGNTPDITPKYHRGSAIRYFQAPFGMITSINNVDSAKLVPGVKEIIFTKGVGDRSTEIRCSNDRIGSVITQGDTASEAFDICEHAMRLVQIDVEP